MKYLPSLPRKNDNVSHNHPLREFVLLLAGVIALVLAVYWSLGLFVDFAVERISPEREAQLFSAAFFNGADKGEPPSDREAALQAIVDNLAPCIDITFPVKVRVQESEAANAAAFPGGHIMVFSGLLDKVESENGLAFVLAHELGHYKNRDHLRLMGRGVVLVSLTAIVTGANADIARVVAPARDFGQARYSQVRESKADRTALEALNCHYGHIGGATEFFEAMSVRRGGIDVGALHYFSSHPELEERIEALSRLAGAMGFSSGEVTRKKFETEEAGGTEPGRLSGRNDQ